MLLDTVGSEFALRGVSKYGGGIRRVTGVAVASNVWTFIGVQVIRADMANHVWSEVRLLLCRVTAFGEGTVVRPDSERTSGLAHWGRIVFHTRK